MSLQWCGEHRLRRIKRSYSLWVASWSGASRRPRRPVDDNEDGFAAVVLDYDYDYEMRTLPELEDQLVMPYDYYSRVGVGKCRTRATCLYGHGSSARVPVLVPTHL